MSKDYDEKKLYLKKDGTLNELNNIISKFKTGDKAMKVFIYAYKLNPEEYEKYSQISEVKINK